jgi:hypothetical protein
MALKFFLNVLCTIGIIVSLYVAYWGYTHMQFMIIAGAVFVGTICVLLKLKIMKEVRDMTKKP